MKVIKLENFSVEILENILSYLTVDLGKIMRVNKLLKNFMMYRRNYIAKIIFKNYGLNSNYSNSYAFYNFYIRNLKIHTNLIFSSDHWHYICVDAVVQNYTDFFRFLIDNNIIITINNSNIYSKYIELAAQYGSLGIVRLCMTRIPSTRHNSAFYLACKNNHFSIVEYMLKNPIVNPIEYNCLNIACINNNIDIVKLLLLNSRISQTAVYSTLEQVYKNKNINIFKLILPHIQLTQNNIKCLLNDAIMDTELEFFKSLFLNQLNTPNINRLFINTCIKFKRVEFIDFMLTNININNYKYELLNNATYYHSLDIIKLLVNNNTDPSYNNNRCIKDASNYGFIDIVEYLLLDKRILLLNNGKDYLEIANNKQDEIIEEPQVEILENEADALLENDAIMFKNWIKKNDF